MNAKTWLKKVPVVGSLGKSVVRHIQTRSDQKVMKLLDSTPYVQGLRIKEVLLQLKRELPQSEQDWIARIEEERRRLLSRNEPLNDGSLGEGGLYDKSITIKKACQVSKPSKQALMLYLLTRAINPQSVIELGTNVGISSAFIGAALKLNGQNGKLITHEASPYRLKLAKEIHSNLGIDNITYIEGLFKDTLSGTLGDVGSVDVAFIDGHHQYKPTLDYFDQIFQFAAPDAVFVFDDIRWSDGMKKAWSQLQADRRLGLAVDLYSVGVCVRAQQTVSQRFVLPPIYYAF